MSDYDVIIVGGRPAGSTLAARLGQQGLRVLMLERATFPTLPGASCPIIYASTMTLLDEIGADEAAYARNTPKIRRMVNTTAELPLNVRLPAVNGRDYAYAIDRARFDHALFENAKRFPTVTARTGVSVVDLLWDADHTRVLGVAAQSDGVRETITADLVVGADGRFSIVARKAGAGETDARDDFPTSIYYAYWRNVKPLDDEGAAAAAWGDGAGIGFLMMDSADETTVFAVEGRADLLDPPPGQAEAFYVALLKRYPQIAWRLDGAHMVTGVHGMKRIGNLYRQPGGAGWALVGDAYHQKDPLDGQGIYDAVFTAKALAKAVAAWQAGRMSWEEALRQYDMTTRSETYPMYESTLRRVRDSFYGQTPAWLQNAGAQTLLRWVMQDRLIQEQMGMMLTRQVRANETLSAPMVVGALLRAPLRQLSRFLDRQIQS